MSSDVGWHIRDKLRPMREHGSILLYVHGNHRLIRTDSSTLTQPLNYENEVYWPLRWSSLTTAVCWRLSWSSLRDHSCLLAVVVIFTAWPQLSVDGCRDLHCVDVCRGLHRLPRLVESYHYIKASSSPCAPFGLLNYWPWCPTANHTSWLSTWAVDGLLIDHRRTDCLLRQTSVRNSPWCLRRC